MCYHLVQMSLSTTICQQPLTVLSSTRQVNTITVSRSNTRSVNNLLIVQKLWKPCSPSCLNFVWLFKHPELEKSRLPVNRLSDQTACTSLQWPQCTGWKEQKWLKLNESWRQMLQVSHNMSFRAFGSRRGARSANYAQHPHLSLIVLFWGRLLTDAVTACLSRTSPFPHFIFTQNSNSRTPSVGLCYLSYITIIFSRPFIATVRTLLPFMASIPQKSRGVGGWKTSSFIFSSYLTQLWQLYKWVPSMPECCFSLCRT